ncbi:hypothetical protein NQZ79_g7594 [Umbelopsis isabellina]|nr:hypothetical protein NQZ79_g7594 [Umbelopsis isabellina]
MAKNDHVTESNIGSTFSANELALMASDWLNITNVIDEWRGTDTGATLNLPVEGLNITSGKEGGDLLSGTVWNTGIGKPLEVCIDLEMVRQESQSLLFSMLFNDCLVVILESIGCRQPEVVPYLE